MNVAFRRGYSGLGRGKTGKLCHNAVFLFVRGNSTTAKLWGKLTRLCWFLRSTTTSTTSPRAMQVTVGTDHMCVLLYTTNAVRCFGVGTGGLLGYGDETDRRGSPIGAGMQRR